MRDIDLVKMIKVENITKDYALYKVLDKTQLDIIGNKIMDNCIREDYAKRTSKLFFITDKYGEFKAALECERGYLLDIQGKKGSPVAEHCLQAIEPWLEESFKTKPEPKFKINQQVSLANEMFFKFFSELPTSLRMECATFGMFNFEVSHRRFNVRQKKWEYGLCYSFVWNHKRGSFHFRKTESIEIVVSEEYIANAGKGPHLRKLF